MIFKLKVKDIGDLTEFDYLSLFVNMHMLAKMYSGIGSIILELQQKQIYSICFT